MSQGILIVSGYNIRAVVAFCRWARARSLPFHLVARDAADPILLTDYRDRVLLVRDQPRLDLATVTHWLRTLRGEYGYTAVLLLPSTEFLNRFMLANTAALQAAGAIIPLVQQALYERISDKYSFGQMCADAGIAVPAEYTSVPQQFPFVAKPLSYAAISQRQLKPYLIYGAQDLAQFQARETAADYYFQEYVTGRSLYLLAYLPKTGAPLLYAQENLMQQPEGASVILARRDDFHRQPEAQRYVDMLAGAGFHGLIMVEVRQQASGQYVMIEANPRLWGPMQLLVDNNIDLFGALLREHGFSVPELPSQTGHGAYYFWSGGFSDAAQVAWHANYTAQDFVADYQAIHRDNLFLRDDSLPLYRAELHPDDAAPTMTSPSLTELYNQASKHSNYQVLARPLRALLPQDSLNITSRYEVERLDYLLARHPVAGKVVADIGGNTGFFTLECAAHGAAQVLYFEGNAAHAAFVTEAARQLHLDQRVHTTATYLNFNGDFPAVVDICLLLNVLHHIGDDYGDAALSRDAAKASILASLRNMANHTSLLVFQLGFNWKGDRHQPLFEHGSKAEVIAFIRSGTADDWDIVDIGIAERSDGVVSYHDLSADNVTRDNSLGEFLNRPLFVLRSKRLPA